MKIGVLFFAKKKRIEKVKEISQKYLKEEEGDFFKK